MVDERILRNPNPISQILVTVAGVCRGHTERGLQDGEEVQGVMRHIAKGCVWVIILYAENMESCSRAMV